MNEVSDERKEGFEDGRKFSELCRNIVDLDRMMEEEAPVYGERITFLLRDVNEYLSLAQKYGIEESREMTKILVIKKRRFDSRGNSSN
ncbi:MAG: hypothetical protein IIA87_00655 [Nanoarchaeota archaeon]|nr:hypothetical protein [Nanoarchaeota archaeon]